MSRSVRSLEPINTTVLPQCRQNDWSGETSGTILLANMITPLNLSDNAIVFEKYNSGGGIHQWFRLIYTDT
jgi:hypothetical protein